MSDEALNQSAAEYLRACLEELGQQAQARGFWTSADGQLSASLVAVINAFRAVGGFSDVEHKAWLKRLREVVETAQERSRLRETPPTAVPVGGTTDVPAHARAEDSALPGVDPVRVIVAPTAATSDGLRIVSVEEYREGVVLRWNLRAVPAADPTTQLPNFELSDDTGSAYQVRRRRVGGGPIVFRGETFFSPAIPEHASELRAEAGALSYVIPLPGPRIS